MSHATIGGRSGTRGETGSWTGQYLNVKRGDAKLFYELV